MISKRKGGTLTKADLFDPESLSPDHNMKYQSRRSMVSAAANGASINAADLNRASRIFENPRAPSLLGG